MRISIFFFAIALSELSVGDDLKIYLAPEHANIESRANFDIGKSTVHCVFVNQSKVAMNFVQPANSAGRLCYAFTLKYADDEVFTVVPRVTGAETTGSTPILFLVPPGACRVVPFTFDGEIWDLDQIRVGNAELSVVYAVPPVENPNYRGAAIVEVAAEPLSVTMR